jgi:hypothetical protein
MSWLGALIHSSLLWLAKAFLFQLDVRCFVFRRAPVSVRSNRSTAKVLSLNGLDLAIMTPAILPAKLTSPPAADRLTCLK